MKKRRFKKEYIIITKEDIAYLQKSIIEFADTAAVQGADIALLNLGTEKIQKILKKIRNNKNNFLYLNEDKNMSLMKLNDEPTLVSPIKLKRYYSSLKGDNSNERIDSIISPSRLMAARYFSKRKNLPLKSYLKIFKISK